jgi:uncharacterized Fe-S cluster-containing protein
MILGMRKQKKKAPGIIISAYVSYEAYDRLERLSEELGTSKSEAIEIAILAVFEALKIFQHLPTSYRESCRNTEPNEETTLEAQTAE